MTKMATMCIYGKNPSKFFSVTGFNETWHEALMTQVLQCVYKSRPCDDDDLLYGNGQHGSPMHLNGKKMLKCHLKGKTCRKLANGQDIDYSEERKNGTRASAAPLLGLFSIIFKHVYIQQISGERLQDRWSSGFEM